MALKLNLKKDELISVAVEMGLEIPSKAKIIDLKKLIESSAVYKNDIEFVRSLVENALEKKKAFQIKSVPDELKAEVLLNILGERVNNLLTYVSQEDLSNYVKIKELILREFEPTPQECLSNFKKARKLPSENYVQFASCLSATFNYYCQLRKVNEFRSLCDLIISDKIFETLDRDTMTHIATKQGEIYFKPQQLGRECDAYLSARGKVSNDLMSRNPGSGVKTDGRYRLQTVGTWRRERNSSNVFVTETKANCVLWQIEGSVEANSQSQFVATGFERGILKNVFLSTVRALVKNKYSQWVEVRCLLDVGSQSCLCTRACAEKLQLKMEKINTVVSCVNDASMVVKNCVKISVANKAKTFESELMLLVVNKITDLIPNKVIDVDVNVSEFVPLADDKFNIPDRIDMLLGAEIFYELLKPGKFYCDNSHLVLQNTVFGYVQDLQRIIWKHGLDAEILTYRLKTVTYGLSNAPFLAIRTLQQLAKDEKSRFPLASETLLYDTYMDDIVSEAPDLETAQQLQSQLKDALQSCGMNLHKWSSNSPELLNSSLSSDVEHSFSTDIDLSVKTLGISWKPFEDCFVFKVSVSAKHIYTKREVLSVIAKLYDPLGFLGPVIAKAKVFLQQLWQCKLDWDDVLPNLIANEWREFVTTLKCIEEVKINRFIMADNNVKIVLQGFADASEAAYGEVVYLQCFLHNGAAKVSILASKSRVAPIRVISIPRLELCACVLLAQLVKKIRSTLRLNISDIVLHTDSTIALAWLNTPLPIV
ncbi:integrase catalytic domain-containing protein [Trichonephila clavipes]|nr:integrase catalytic domain-containing protein [Trichonephila clavipes]